MTLIFVLKKSIQDYLQLSLELSLEFDHDKSEIIKKQVIPRL